MNNNNNQIMYCREILFVWSMYNNYWLLTVLLIFEHGVKLDLKAVQKSG